MLNKIYRYTTFNKHCVLDVRNPLTTIGRTKPLTTRAGALGRSRGINFDKLHLVDHNKILPNNILAGNRNPVILGKSKSKIRRLFSTSNPNLMDDWNNPDFNRVGPGDTDVETSKVVRSYKYVHPLTIRTNTQLTKDQAQRYARMFTWRYPVIKCSESLLERDIYTASINKFTFNAVGIFKDTWEHGIFILITDEGSPIPGRPKMAHSSTPDHSTTIMSHPWPKKIIIHNDGDFVTYFFLVCITLAILYIGYFMYPYVVSLSSPLYYIGSLY